MTRRVRSRLLVPGILACAVALTACGGAGSSLKSAGPGAFKLISATPDKTAAAKTARFTGRVSAEGGGRSVDVRFDGTFDLAAHAASFTMNLGQLGLPGGAGTAEIRLVDGVLYMNLGNLAGAAGSALSIPAGKSWLKLDVNALAQSFGAGRSGGLGGLGGIDPSQAVDALRGVSSDVKEVGKETVRGVETTHYRVQLDLAKAVDQVPPDLRDRVKRGLDALGSGTIPADVWIGADGVLRKLTMTMGGSKPGGVGNKAVNETVTFELFDFGASVEVQAPPADQTADFSDMLGGMLNGLGAGSSSN